MVLYSTMYKVDRDIPIPPINGRGEGRKNPKLYPWDEMKVGDSFFVDTMLMHHMAPTVQRQQLGRPGVKYTIRTIGTGVRVWRTA